MKRVISKLSLSMLCVSILVSISGCTDEFITKYYSVVFYPADSVLNLHKFVIKETYCYDSDSVAVERETRLYHKLQDKGQMEIEKANGKENANEVYLRMRDELRSVVRITYRKNVNLNRLITLLEEYGDKSDAVINYCKDNNIDYISYSLLPYGYDYIYHGISINCIGTRDLAICYETSKKLSQDQILHFVTEKTDIRKDNYSFQTIGKLDYASLMYNRKINTIIICMHDENKFYNYSFNGSGYTLDSVK